MVGYTQEQRSDGEKQMKSTAGIEPRFEIDFGKLQKSLNFHYS